MKKHIFILMIAMLSTTPLLAQYSHCYETAFAEGKKHYNAGNYAKAKTYFNEAKDCPDPNAMAADEWIGKCNKMIRKAEEARQKAEQKAREEARLRELAAEKKRQEEAERKREEEEARQRELAAEKRRQEEAERKRREEDARKREQANQISYSTKTSHKAPWEYLFGFGILGFELRRVDYGNLPVDAEHAVSGGMGLGLKLELFYSMRKFLGSSDCFIMPSCTSSFGFLSLIPNSNGPILDDNNLKMYCFQDYVFPSVSFGTELYWLGDWNISIGGGYYMDFMYGLHAKTKISNSLNNSQGETISHDATILSHYTGGLAGTLRFNEDDEGIVLDIIVGFPKAIDCEVEGYNCQIKAPVVILSLNVSWGEWERIGR